MHAFRKKIQESSGYRWWVLGFVMIGTFMAVLDITVVNVGMPAIMSAFDIGLSTAEWVITAYMITMTIMLPTAGWLADRFGNKNLYILGLVLFTLGSWLCGRAPDDTFLIASRALQGIGSGIIQSLGLAIVTREFTASERGTALGLWAVAAAASISFGPLIGGFLIDKFSWHLIFDVNVPLGLLGITGALVIQKEWKNPALKHFDWLGFLFAALFMPLVIYGLARGNATTNPLGWKAPEVLWSFIVGGASLVGFVVTELKSKSPLLDIRLLGERNFGVSMAVLALFGIGMIGGSYLIPLYLMNGLDYTAIMAGSVFLPVGLIQGLLSMTSGALTRYIKPIFLIFAGICLMTLSFWLASRFTIHNHHSFIMLSLYLRGFGMGLTFAPLNTFALKHLSQDQMAAAAGISNSIKQLFGSIGVALLTSLLTSRVAHHAALHTESHKQAYVSGITDDFFIVAVLTLCALLPFLLLLRKKKVGREEHTAAGIKK